MILIPNIFQKAISFSARNSRKRNKKRDFCSKEKRDNGVYFVYTIRLLNFSYNNNNKTHLNPYLF